MTPPLDLDAIEARAKAATPGPWTDVYHQEIATEWDDEENKGIVICLPHIRWRPGDKVFIAHAREDVPALLAAIAELERENFALAADQCHAGYGDEFGNHRCKAVDEASALLMIAQREIATLTDENERLREALVYIKPLLVEERDMLFDSYVIRYTKDPNVGELSAEGKEQISPWDEAIAAADAVLNATADDTKGVG